MIQPHCLFLNGLKGLTKANNCCMLGQRILNSVVWVIFIRPAKALRITIAVHLIKKNQNSPKRTLKTVTRILLDRIRCTLKRKSSLGLRLLIFIHFPPLLNCSGHNNGHRLSPVSTNYAQNMKCTVFRNQSH